MKLVIRFVPGHNLILLLVCCVRLCSHTCPRGLVDTCWLPGHCFKDREAGMAELESGSQGSRSRASESFPSLSFLLLGDVYCAPFTERGLVDMEAGAHHSSELTLI